jgi:hypothetical protein
MSQLRRDAPALVALLLALAACGGGSSPPATATPAETPVDSRVTLAAYVQNHAASAPELVAPDATLRAALALALPALQSTVSTANGDVLVADHAIVLPALQAARVDVLRVAAAGDTLAELEAALPAEASRDAVRPLLDGISRSLWAPTAALFERGFLASTDTGGAAAEPWRAMEVTDWSAAAAALADFGSVDALHLVADTRLVIGQRFHANALANGQAVAFDGVGLRRADRWYTAPMVALEGPGGTLLGEGYTATATWVGDHLWVSLRPPGDAPLYEGVPPATLSTALLEVWSAYSASGNVKSRSTQVWPQVTMALEDRSRLPAGIALPYDAVHANLSGLDGGGTFLTETTHSASLTIDTAGLHAAGAQAMAFTFSVANEHGGGYASGGQWVVLPVVWPTSCPRAAADWRGAYLALIDRAGRLLLVASLPDAGSAATECMPI